MRSTYGSLTLAGSKADMVLENASSSSSLVRLVVLSVQHQHFRTPLLFQGSLITKQRLEVDFLTSYYSQDGNNASVTGGIGTEELTDLTGTSDCSTLSANLSIGLLVISISPLNDLFKFL